MNPSDTLVYCMYSGCDRFAQDISVMTGRTVPATLRLVWSIIIPFFIMVSKR